MYRYFKILFNIGFHLTFRSSK